LLQGVARENGVLYRIRDADQSVDSLGKLLPLGADWGTEEGQVDRVLIGPIIKLANHPKRY